MSKKKKRSNSIKKEKDSPETVEVTVADYARATDVNRNAIYNRIQRIKKGEGQDFPDGVTFKKYDLPTGPLVMMVVEIGSRTYDRHVKKVLPGQ